MKIGFTGTRHGLTPAQWLTIEKYFEHLRNYGQVELHHGGAVGADSEVEALAMENGFTIHIYPAAGSRRAQELAVARELTFASVSESDFLNSFIVVHAAAPPLTRNKEIVRVAEVLLAAPRTATAQLRSGTWATIRYAQKARLPIILVEPDGSVRRHYHD